MSYTKITFIAILCILGIHLTKAQDTLLINGQSFADGIVIRWQPLSPEIWDSLLTTGYRVERQELPDGPTVVLEEKLLPKDTFWFAENKTQIGGMMEVIGALLHDTTFQFEDKSLLDANSMRYNYILHEAEYYPTVAVAVGCGVMDSLVTEGKTYRYSITGIGTDLNNSLEITAGEPFKITSPEGVGIKYTFPNDQSLSDMSPEKKNYVFPQIVGTARAYGDSIVLRWGPNTLQLFRDTKRDGYSIERFDQDGNKVEIALVKPWTQDQITPAIEHDSFALLAASNLFPPKGAVATNFYEKAALEENRFGFSLYAAERSQLAADILGMRFVDRDVEKDVFYTYIIKTETTPNFLSHASIGIENTYVPPEPPEGLTLDAGDKVLQLSWAKSNERNYSSYELERSEDGNNWKKLTDKPIVFLETKDIPLEIFDFVDSIGVNNKKFYYRLKGYDSFGELSEGATVEGVGIDLTPPDPPKIEEGEYFKEEGKITIKWTPAEIPDDFAGYWILLGKDRTGNFDTLTQVALSADATEYTFESDTISGDRAHYFRILVQDESGNANESEPYYVHVPDLTAPPPPEGFGGFIGDDGKVTLYWEHSTAKDIGGYWIYFANDPTDEFSPIHGDMIVENAYEYFIDDKSLNKSIYYMVASEDLLSNRGVPSEILELKRPDKVPPIMPFQFQPEGTSRGISISWERSPSEDVMSYHIYRRVYNSDEEWELVSMVTSESDSVFMDTSAVYDVIYEYKMLAEDDSGNQSEFTLESSSKRSIDPSELKIDNLTAQISKDQQSVSLSWSFEPPAGILPPGVTYDFVILKSKSAENVEYHDQIQSASPTYNDAEGLIPRVLYNYAVQIRLSNGLDGQMSPVKSVMID